MHSHEKKKCLEIDNQKLKDIYTHGHIGMGASEKEFNLHNKYLFFNTISFFVNALNSVDINITLYHGENFR